MKSTFFTVLLVTLALMFAGCSSTRKATQTKVEQSITESSETTSTTHAEKSEGLLTLSNITENLNAVIDFTRVEFNDGTTLIDILPPIIGDSVKQCDREQTEPPNAGIKSKGGIKAITTGRVDLSNKKNETTETAMISDSKSDTSQIAVNNSSSDTHQEEQSEEKDKRGWLHYLGEIIVALITIIVVGFIFRLINKIDWKSK